jgi:hypothetical protein
VYPVARASSERSAFQCYGNNLAGSLPLVRPETSVSAKYSDQRTLIGLEKFETYLRRSWPTNTAPTPIWVLRDNALHTPRLSSAKSIVAIHIELPPSLGIPLMSTEGAL